MNILPGDGLTRGWTYPVMDTLPGGVVTRGGSYPVMALPGDGRVARRRMFHSEMEISVCISMEPRRRIFRAGHGTMVPFKNNLPGDEPPSRRRRACSSRPSPLLPSPPPSKGRSCHLPMGGECARRDAPSKNRAGLKAYAQWIVTTRLLYHVHDPPGQSSRMQGIHPRAL